MISFFQTDGLYRRNASATRVREILNILAEGALEDIPSRLYQIILTLDPVDTVLPHIGDDDVYAVCEALRRYFRNLSQPLIEKSLHEKLYNLGESG